MQTLTLNNGVLAPSIGFGTYRISPSSTRHFVDEAIKNGYRLFDTAEYYGNEAGVGQAVNESGISREEFFITSKTHLGGYEAAKRAIDKSLRVAGQDYFDLMLVHFTMPDFLGTYQALAEAYEAGKLRSIGVSNFDIHHLQMVMEQFDVIPAVNQVETNVYTQNKDLVRFMKDQGIVMEAYAPLGEGPNPMFHDPYLNQLAGKYRKTVAQIMLKFLLQSGFMAIPGSQNLLHIKENIEIFDFEFTEEEMENLRNLDRGTSNWLGYQG